MSKWQECPQWGARARWPVSGGLMLPRQEVWIKNVQVTRVSPVSSQGRWLDSEEVLEPFAERVRRVRLTTKKTLVHWLEKPWFIGSSTSPEPKRFLVQRLLKSRWTNVVFAYTFCSTARDTVVLWLQKLSLFGFLNQKSCNCIPLVTGNKKAPKKEVKNITSRWTAYITLKSSHEPWTAYWFTSRWTIRYYEPLNQALWSRWTADLGGSGWLERLPPGLGLVGGLAGWSGGRKEDNVDLKLSLTWFSS